MTRNGIIVAALACIALSTGCIGVTSSRTVSCSDSEIIVIRDQAYLVNKRTCRARPIELQTEPADAMECEPVN